jgi:hypothetical protein
MIYFPSSKFNISRELPVAVGASVTAEGAALIADNTGGVFGAKMSAAGGSEVFLGLSVGQQMTLTSLTKAESFVQPGSNTVTLAFTPTASTLGVWDVTTGAVIAAGGGGWSLSGKVVTLQAGTVGHELVCYYKYSPTAAQARMVQGDVFPGGPAGTAISQIGVIANGIVYTDQFDTSVNWNAASIAVKTAANGQLTIGGAGTTLTNVKVIAPPVAGFPFLGLLID